MLKQKNLDPFSYGKLDVISTLVQVATAIAGIILALNGNTAGLLALGALAGGTKGSLIGDLGNMVMKDLQKPKKPRRRNKGILLIMVIVAVFAVGCSGISQQYLVDSRKAILAGTGDYLSGCQSLVVAPAFNVDWKETVTYGGGVFAGCPETGQMMDLTCQVLEDTETGELKMVCKPVSLWERRVQEITNMERKNINVDEN